MKLNTEEFSMLDRDSEPNAVEWQDAIDLQVYYGVALFAECLLDTNKWQVGRRDPLFSGFNLNVDEKLNQDLPQMIESGD
ncbi:MAG: hypothetical protein VYE18_05000 [Pseudomonadota bacterium]|nr:hypothetical protein [Pseudomonadota bacterium]